jgi:hypothetical protein
MNIGTWLQQAQDVWVTQVRLAEIDRAAFYVLKPRMYLVHWSMELYLKALQMDLGLAPPASHDLIDLYQTAVREAPDFYSDAWLEAVAHVNPFNADDFGGVRYPSPEPYTLDSRQLESLESLIAKIVAHVDPVRDIADLVPRLQEILSRRAEELAVARRRVQAGRAPLDEAHLFAFLETSKQIEYWLTEVADIGWQIGPLSNVATPLAMAAAAGITKMAELTQVLKDAKLWGREFLERTFANQRAEWKKLGGPELGPPTMDRQGPLVYLLIATYPQIFTAERLQRDFGWGRTTAVTDAIERSVDT